MKGIWRAAKLFTTFSILVALDFDAQNPVARWGRSVDYDLLPRVFALAIILLLGWLICRPRFAWLVKIEAGQPRVVRGKLSPSIMQDFEEVFREAAVDKGWMGAVATGRRTQLKFSCSIPPECRQRLRNVWNLG